MDPRKVSSTFKINKVIHDKTLEDLIKDFKELKVELTALRKNQRSNTSQPVERSKDYVVSCIWCDDPNHKSLEEVWTLQKALIFFSVLIISICPSV